MEVNAIENLSYVFVCDQSFLMTDAAIFLSVLVDFCKLTIDYLNNGVNSEKCTVAAGE